LIVEAVIQAEGYKVTLNGPGISVDQSVDQGKAREILHILLGGGIISGSLSGAPNRVNSQALHEGPSRTPPRVSLREFMEEVEAKRNPDKIVAIGEYLTEIEGKSDFGKDDVKAHFRTAGEPLPANYPRDFQWTLQSGWIAEDSNNPGRFYVTRKGKDAISQKFVKDVQRKLSQTPVGRRRSRRSPGMVATTIE
jgi:hypothetical protein